jgi:Putative auto-transporter adhesin, head GIN domain
MKQIKTKTGLSLLTAGIVLTGCFPFDHIITGSGECISTNKNISGFKSVSVHNGCHAEITKGDSYSVSIYTDDNIQTYVETWKEGTTLNIGLEPANSYQPTQFKAYITCPDIEALSGSGGSSLKFTDTKKMPKRTISLSGGSTYTGTVTADTIDASLSGGSDCTITGTVSYFKITGSGGSECGARNLTVSYCKSDLSGGSKAVAIVNTELRGQLSGGSEFFYFGTPAVNVNTSGGAVVRKIN